LAISWVTSVCDGACRSDAVATRQHIPAAWSSDMTVKNRQRKSVKKLDINTIYCCAERDRTRTLRRWAMFPFDLVMHSKPNDLSTKLSFSDITSRFFVLLLCCNIDL
jgi:hypothetical protein